MARPQLEDGRTEIANELLEAIIRTHFSPTEHSVLWAVIRKTYGWHKKIDRISFTQFEELTGINRWHIAPVLQGLIKRNIIIRQGEKQALEYGIQEDFDLWQPLPKSVTATVTNNGNSTITKTGNDTVTKTGNEPLPKQVTAEDGKPLPILEKTITDSGETVTKTGNETITNIGTHKSNKAITKETIQKKGYVLPEWINEKTWYAFLEMRKRIKKPLTDYGCQVAIKKLQKLKDGGQDPNAILDTSILNSWQGIWPEKGSDKNGKDGQNPQQSGSLKDSIRRPITR
jgi:phage replication O-like protein O